MSDDMIDLGRATLFGAEAIGEPGNRRFRLYARSRRGAASLWLEREQLEALGKAIDQLLAQITTGMLLRSEAQAHTTQVPSAPATFPEEPDVDFPVGNMQIGYDEADDQIVLRAGPLVLIERDGELFTPEEPEFLFAVTVTRQQAERASNHIAGILSSGRPRCPFCGKPMQAGHICDKQNGYHPAVLN